MCYIVYLVVQLWDAVNTAVSVRCHDAKAVDDRHRCPEPSSVRRSGTPAWRGSHVPNEVKQAESAVQVNMVVTALILLYEHISDEPQSQYDGMDQDRQT